MIDQIQNRIENAIKSSVFPGCVVGIYEKGKEPIVLPFGKYTYDNDSPVVQKDTVYDVASITKAIPTSCIALQLIDKNKLHLDDHLISFVPEFTGQYRELITIRHLLTQTLDFDFRLSSLRNLPPSGIIDSLMSVSFRSIPGAVYSYANATSILLGIVLERIYNKRLDIIAQETFFSPLRMISTSFWPEKLPVEKIVPTEIDNWRGRKIQAEVHDESAWALRPEYVVGSAGLFSNVPDLLQFVKMLVDGGAFEGHRFFSDYILNQMYKNQLHLNEQITGLGWELGQSVFMGKQQPNSFGKTGFTGCSVVINLPRSKGIVLLSNCTFPERKKDRSLINSVRSDLADIIFN